MLSPKKKAVGSVPSPRSRRPQSLGLGGGLEGTQRLSAFRPGEERLGSKKVTRAPLGTPGACGQDLDPSASPPGGCGSSLGGDAGPGAGPPGGGSKTEVWESQAHGWLSPGPPSPPQGPPLIKFKLRLLGALPTPLPLSLFRTTSPLHSSFVSCPPLILHPPLRPSCLQAGA